MFDEGLRQREIAKFHPYQNITEGYRPFSIFIEFENDSQNSLQYEGNGVP